MIVSLEHGVRNLNLKISYAYKCLGFSLELQSLNSFINPEIHN